MLPHVQIRAFALSCLALVYPACSPPDREPLLASANDNRVPAGRMVGGELHLTIEARAATWRPDLGVDTAVSVQAFAEGGRRASVPGPLIRATSGTEIVVALRNSIRDSVLIVSGLRAGTVTDDTLYVAAGEVREVRFRAERPGTYMYWGSASGYSGSEFANNGRNSTLAGAIVIDSVGAVVDPRERIFVLSLIDILPDSVKGTKEDIWDLAINGRSWPHTERITTTVGDAERWRWVNATYLPHPMHLHGFHFRRSAKGDGYSDSTYTGNDVQEEVTEFMMPGSTFAMEWTPTRAGNWLMHCHMVPHITPFPERPDSTRDHDMHDAASHPSKAMSGLILGITTVDRNDAGSEVPSLPGGLPRTRIFAQQASAGSGDSVVSRGFIVQHGTEPASDSVESPSSTLFAARGQTSVVTVINRLSEATTVHWHGIELESIYDGVAGWSGARTNIAPMIAPGDSFSVSFTPPRSGTYIYHTHIDEGKQLITGMYAPLIVLEPGERFDAEFDRVLLLGRVASGGKEVPAINGRPSPQPMRMKAGVAYRLRIINMLPAAPAMLTLASDSTPVVWRAWAKDGADLPESHRVDKRAQQVVGVGETYDFVWTPAGTGRFVLRATEPNGVLLAAQTFVVSR